MKAHSAEKSTIGRVVGPREINKSTVFVNQYFSIHEIVQDLRQVNLMEGMEMIVEEKK